MNELGLDPGIDHLSAMKIIHHLQQQGATITSFKSYTGGLVAPEYDNNPWNYKFTWNPRNVVLAGQGVAKYIVNNNYKYVPYHRLFTDIQTISVKGYGNFDGYPNRDSLSYRKVYGLENIPTMLRGTLRKEGFCEAWNVFVQLGITDDSYQLEHSQQMTYRQFIDAYLPANNSLSVEEKLKNVIGHDKKAIFDKIVWLGLLTDTPIPLQNASPAQILQHVLEQKWALGQADKDMIVMQHIFEYELKGKKHELYSSLVVKGDNIHSTAMAKTVGLPLAIGAKLYLEGKLDGLSGVHIPIMPMIYEPILEELASIGIIFQEQVI
jgi:saccharopine dehydrogenase (NADP+, L-glutamate forming)